MIEKAFNSTRSGERNVRVYCDPYRRQWLSVNEIKLLEK